MEDQFEERLTTLFDRAKGGSDVPVGVYQRLQFLARVLPHAPGATGDTLSLLWLDADGQTRFVTLPHTRVLIGRDATCEVVLSSPRVSRRHCAVTLTGHGPAGVELEDLGSTNGTRVNGTPLPAHGKRELRDGDVIEAGGVALAVAVAGARPRP